MPNVWNTLESLENLNLADNRIKKTETFPNSLPVLKTINLSNNNITGVKFVYIFFEWKTLRGISLSGNSIDAEEEYKLHFIKNAPYLTHIDEEELTQEDRDNSADYFEQKRLAEEEAKREAEELRRHEEEEEEAEKKRLAKEAAGPEEEDANQGEEEHLNAGETLENDENQENNDESGTQDDSYDD